MRRQLIIASLAAIAGWTFVPTEAGAFGHHRRRGGHGHHGHCAPQPVSCCQPTVQYHSAPEVYSQPAPVSSGCCGGSSMGGYAGQPMYNELPPQPMPMQGGYQDGIGYQDGGVNYQGQGGYQGQGAIQGAGAGYNQQGYGQGSANVGVGQQGARGNVSGNVGGADVNARGNVNGGNVGAGANAGGNLGGGANAGGNVDAGAAGGNINAGGAANAAGGGL